MATITFTLSQGCVTVNGLGYNTSFNCGQFQCRAYGTQGICIFPNNDPSAIKLIVSNWNQIRGSITPTNQISAQNLIATILSLPPVSVGGTVYVGSLQGNGTNSYTLTPALNKTVKWVSIDGNNLDLDTWGWTSSSATLALGMNTSGYIMYWYQ